MSRRNPKVGFVTLRGPEAVVDRKGLLIQLCGESCDIVPGYAFAIVNACGLIETMYSNEHDLVGRPDVEGRPTRRPCMANFSP